LSAIALIRQNHFEVAAMDDESRLKELLAVIEADRDYWECGGSW
jgi:hypothetical protein